MGLKARGALQLSAKIGNMLTRRGLWAIALLLTVVPVTTDAAPAVTFRNSHLNQPTCGWKYDPSMTFLGAATSIAANAPNDIWVIGRVRKQTMTLHYDGVRWSRVPSPNRSAEAFLFAGTAVSASDVWAVGRSLASGGYGYATLTENWNGSRWRIIPSPSPGGSNAFDELFSVAAFGPNNVWTVGHTLSNGTQTLAEFWNGSTWTVSNTVNPNPSYSLFRTVTGSGPSDVWALGQTMTATGSPALAEHWDGTTWQVVTMPTITGYDYIFGSTTLSSTNVWALGASFGGTFVQSLAEHWDGSTWSIVPTQNVAGADNYLVSATSLPDGEIWAVGSTIPPNGVPRLLVEHWDGRAWTIQPAQIPTSLGQQTWLHSVYAFSSTDVYAVGEMSYADTALERYCI